jgi:hypothetical protein
MNRHMILLLVGLSTPSASIADALNNESYDPPPMPLHQIVKPEPPLQSQPVQLDLPLAPQVRAKTHSPIWGTPDGTWSSDQSGPCLIQGTRNTSFVKSASACQNNF